MKRQILTATGFKTHQSFAAPTILPSGVQVTSEMYIKAPRTATHTVPYMSLHEHSWSGCSYIQCCLGNQETRQTDLVSKLQGEYKGRQAKEYKPTSDGNKLSFGGGCPTLGGIGCSIGCTGRKSASCRCTGANCIASRRCFVSCQLSSRICNFTEHIHLPH